MIPWVDISLSLFFRKDYFIQNGSQRKRKSFIPPKVHLSLASHERFLHLSRMLLLLIWDTYWVLPLYDCMIDDGYFILTFLWEGYLERNIWEWDLGNLIFHEGMEHRRHAFASNGMYFYHDEIGCLFSCADSIYSHGGKLRWIILFWGWAGGSHQEQQDSGSHE